MIDKYLYEATIEKKVFSLAELKRKFPKERAKIKQYLFLSLIEPVNYEFPDDVKANVSF